MRRDNRGAACNSHPARKLFELIAHVGDVGLSAREPMKPSNERRNRSIGEHASDVLERVHSARANAIRLTVRPPSMAVKRWFRIPPSPTNQTTRAHLIILALKFLGMLSRESKRDGKRKRERLRSVVSTSPWWRTSQKRHIPAGIIGPLIERLL